jgi:cell wall-associated NlpC family hydrolase
MGKLVDAARKYIGVRHRHRGRSPHAVDCAGLGILAYADCGVALPDFRLYGREPHKDGLVTYMTAALGDPLPTGSELQDGDVIVLRFDKEPHHVAIVAEVDYGGTAALNMIHSDGHVGRVIEQRLSQDIADRITHIYRKGVE